MIARNAVTVAIIVFLALVSIPLSGRDPFARRLALGAATETCAPPLLVAVVDFPFDRERTAGGVSEGAMHMIKNYFRTLRAHSTIDFVGLAATSERCAAFVRLFNEQCDVFTNADSDSAAGWSKQVFAREVARRLKTLQRPVVLTDVDIRFEGDPLKTIGKLVCEQKFDFLGADEGSWNINSGVMMFAATSSGLAVLECVAAHINRVSEDVDEAFQRLVLDKVPVEQRVPGKSDLRNHGATALTFEQDVVKDCVRNAVTGETDMRFSVIIAQHRVAGSDSFHNDVYEHPLRSGDVEYGYFANSCGGDSVGLRCAQAHPSFVDGAGRFALLDAPYYSGPKDVTGTSVTLRHCVGKEAACLYDRSL